MQMCATSCGPFFLGIPMVAWFGRSVSGELPELKISPGGVLQFAGVEGEVQVRVGSLQPV